MYRKSVNRGGFVRIEDGAYIPDDPNNMDYVRVLEWLDAGNSPDVTPDAQPSYEQAKSDEYLKQKNANSVTDVILDMLEVVIDELDARGKNKNPAFQAAVDTKKAVADKVQKPKEISQ